MLYSLPDGWQSFSDEVLQSRLAEIAALAAALDIDIDGGIEQAEALADAKEAVEAELASRSQARAAEEDRRAAALARLTTAAADDTDDGDDDDGDSLADAGSDDDEGEPSTLADSTEIAPAAVEPVAVEPEATPTLAADDDPAPEPEVVEPEVVDTPAPTPAVPAASALQAMNLRRTSGELPRAANGARNGRMRAVGAHGSNGWQEGDWLDNEEALATHFANYINRTRSGGAWNGDRVEIPLVSSTWAFDEDEQVTAVDVDRNYRVLDRASGQFRDRLVRNVNDDAIVAAGGPCAPLMPTYEFIACYGGPQRPIEAGLPVVGAPRGGIKFIDPVPLNAESAAAVTELTVAQAATVPPVTKGTTRVSCPTETEVFVYPVSWSVTFDNLNYRVFPEQVSDMLRRVQVEFAKAKEISYLDQIDAFAPTALEISAEVTHAYGASRSLYQDLRMAAHNYRKRNNLDPMEMLDVYLPTVVEDILAVDFTNSHEQGGLPSIAGGPSGNLAVMLARRCGLNVTWYYYDSTAVGFPPSAHDGAAATYNLFPTEIRSYITQSGSLVRLNGGSLDLGVVRDSTLNLDNDLQLFAEEWVAVAHPGCEILALDHTVHHDGHGAFGVDQATQPV